MSITARQVSAGIFCFFVGRLIDRYGPLGAHTRLRGNYRRGSIGVSRANALWQIIALFGLAGMTELAAPRAS
ncbi:MAG: hypothetical protein BZY77_01940 [SAR202 cluster bacterium Io17-Chloro-G5]|nr:MAG: hypothetical protein BZY77_01940 [SAR202 cluster bacterium Io17-Chloro-G5]